MHQTTEWFTLVLVRVYGVQTCLKINSMPSLKLSGWWNKRSYGNLRMKHYQICRQMSWFGSGYHKMKFLLTRMWFYFLHTVVSLYCSTIQVEINCSNMSYRNIWHAREYLLGSSNGFYSDLLRSIPERKALCECRICWNS